MELYLVKEEVELVDLEEWHLAMAPQNDGERRQFKKYLSFYVLYPCLVKSVGQSKFERELAGKFREVIEREFGWSEIHFCLSVWNNLQKREFGGWVTFSGNVDEKGLHLIFGRGERDYRIWMDLSLCHLATKDAPVPEDDDDLFWSLGRWMKSDLDGDGRDRYGFESENQDEIEQVEKLWSHPSGFIHAKLRISVELSEDAVERVMDREEPQDNLKKLADQYSKMLEEEIGTDLEVLCGDGKIVKCHRSVVGAGSEVFRNMFQESGWREARTGKLEMEEMSEQGVRALLRWVYWRDEREALEESAVAVKLLIAGDKYGVEGLVEGMKDIILERRGYDEEWFGVGGALELYGWAKLLEGMKELREKAVSVLKFFGKNYPEKLEASDEYQELIESDVEAAMELSQDN